MTFLCGVHLLAGTKLSSADKKSFMEVFCHISHGKGVVDGVGREE